MDNDNNNLMEEILSNSNRLKELQQEISDTYRVLINLFCKLSSIFVKDYFDKIKKGDILFVLSCDDDGDLTSWEVELVEKTEEYINCKESRSVFIRHYIENEEKCGEKAEYASCIITRQMYDELKNNLPITQYRRTF